MTRTDLLLYPHLFNMVIYVTLAKYMRIFQWTILLAISIKMF